jgi:hypothetical protein
VLAADDSYGPERDRLELHRQCRQVFSKPTVGRSPVA